PMIRTVLVIVARLIFAAVFAIGVWFKFTDMEATAGYIASAGFPIPLVLAWLAALFETALLVPILSGSFFSGAALLAPAYVFFLAFVFHGPAHWQPDQIEFGFFVNHFTFIAALFFAAVHGPGSKWVVPAGVLWRPHDA